MRNIMKVTLAIAAITISISAILNLMSCQDPKVEEEKRKTEDKLKIKRAVSDMVAKYNAVEDWNSVFKKKDVSESIYTIYVQEALLNTNKRPILFYAYIGDIIRRKNDFIIHFETWLDHPDIRFELLCNKAQVESLLKSTGNTLDKFAIDKFAIVALIENVQRPVFAIKPYALNEEETEIEITTPDTFIATGKFLDFIHVGDLLSD